MPQVAEPVPCAYDLPPDRVRWTRVQCDAIQEAGILTGRYELIDGEIISKMSVNPPHSGTLIALRLWLTILFGGECVRTESPVEVGVADPEHNRPQPDISVTKESYTHYFTGHPAPDELVLAVEVSDSTLRSDRSIKAMLYSRAVIGEYWIVDIAGRQVYIHRQPTEAGYLDIKTYSDEEMVTTLARPGESVRVANLLPPV